MPFVPTRMVWLLMLGAALGPTAATLQAQTTLRYQFKTGDKIRYRLENLTETSLRPMNREITSKIAQNQEMTWQVSAVGADGKARIKLTIDRWTMTSEGPGGKFNLDSTNVEKDDDDPVRKNLASLIKALVAVEFAFSLSATGDMTDLVVPESILKAKGREQLGDLFSQEGLQRLLGQGGLVLPGAAVTRGKTWEQTMTTKMLLGQLKTRLSFSYGGQAARQGRNLELINLTTHITLEGDPKADLKLTLKNQEGKGTAYFDNGRGRLVELTLDQTMQMEVSGLGQTAQQNLKQTTVLKLLDR